MRAGPSRPAAHLRDDAPAQAGSPLVQSEAAERIDAGMRAAIPPAQAHRRAGGPQVAKALLATSPAPRQTPGKRTPCHCAVLAITCRHSGPATHARDGTQWHLSAPTSTIVSAFARRRSAVRTRCGPPLICRDAVSSEPSARRPDRRLQPSATQIRASGLASHAAGVPLLVVATARPRQGRHPRLRVLTVRVRRD